MTISRFLLACAIPFLLGGCKKYLSEEPLKQASIQTTDQLEDLINNISLFAQNGAHDPSGCYGTDDTEIPVAAYSAYPASFTFQNLSYYTFSVEQVETQPSDALWTAQYKAIFTANLILSYLDQVTGSDSVKTVLRADAHFIRAYCYWDLANHYCLPYSTANAGAPGLPLKRTLDYSESLNRSTLQETYDYIMADVQAAQQTTRDDVDPTKPWRVCKKAIYAFLSRYYLFTGDYTRSGLYSDSALMTQSVSLMDFHTIVAGTPATYTNPAVTLKYSALNTWTTFQIMTWQEFFYARFCYNSSQFDIPSTALLALYDTANDLRYKWFMIPNSNRRFNMVNAPLFRYDVFSDGRYIPTGPTIAEMYLNKAEVLARKGDAGGAMQEVNILRAQRMSTAAPLTATDAADALQKVLQERRREMPFGMRWFDIRRFSVNDDPSDDVTVTRSFYAMGTGAVDTTSKVTYTLAPGSKRYAVPINSLEITNSNGQIVQNQY